MELFNKVKDANIIKKKDRFKELDLLIPGIEKRVYDLITALPLDNRWKFEIEEMDTDEAIYITKKLGNTVLKGFEVGVRHELYKNPIIEVSFKL